MRDATFDVLRRLELTTIFSNPGSTEVPFLAGLPEDLRFVLALHEGSVVGMAAGYALGRGAPALVLLHSTPGLGNAVAALATARLNRAPLVVVVGQQDRRHLALDPFLAGRLHGLAGEYPVSRRSAGARPGRARARSSAPTTRPSPAAGRRWSSSRWTTGPPPPPSRTRSSARSCCCARAAADPAAVAALAGILDCARAPAIIAGAGAD